MEYKVAKMDDRYLIVTTHGVVVLGMEADETIDSKNMANISRKTFAENPDDKIFFVEGAACTLQEFLHVNTASNTHMPEENYLRKLFDLKVGETLTDENDPNAPPVKRIK